MSQARPLGPGIEHFNVARGAVTRTGRALCAYLGLVASLVVGFVVLLPALGVATRTLLVVGPLAAVGTLVGLFVYLNLPGSLDVGADGVTIDRRDGKRFVPFTDLRDTPPYRDYASGKIVTGVSLELKSGEVLKVPIGDDVLCADKRVGDLSSRIRARLDAYDRREQMQRGRGAQRPRR
jgi:hypothetical protein